MKKFIAIAIMGFALVSCSSLYGPKPSLSLVDAAITDVTLLETTLLLKVRIENDGPRPLYISGATHRIYLNGIDIGKGTSDQDLEIKEFGTDLQEVTVYLSNLSMANKIRSLIETKDFNYRIESTLYTGGGWIDRGISVSNSGSINLTY